MRHLTLSLLMLIGGVALADTWTDSATGYTWTYADVDGGVEIRGERTGGWWSTSYAAAIDPVPTGRLDVPVTLGGKPVVSIGECAFYDCNEIEGITIPDTVVNIGDFAFTCTLAYNTALHDVEIPNSVTNIGKSIFKGCKNLTNVVIGTGVKCIGDSAFNGCPISEMSIPDSVVEVQQGAFYNCTNLNRICVGTGLKTLGDRNPFAVSSIRTFEVADGNANFMSSNGLLLSKDGRNLISGVNGNVSIPNGVTNVYPHAFYFLNTEESVNITIPRSVVSIGECAFASNWKLARILIPDGVETIGECAFSGCGLTNVIVAASVTNIGACAFGDGFSDRFTSRRIYFEGNAPVCQKVSDREIFHLVSKQYPPVVYVQRGSKGWDGDPDSSVLPNKWQGCEIKWYGVGVSINARQRYPWNGLVDLHFTITGDAGTKYDTSFTAKDMVGNTNIAMKTIRKSNSVAAEEKEKLLPGTYNWVWDAAADLPNDFKCERVTVTGTAEQSQGLYMVIDLSSGANSSKYPVSYLDDVPSGGWSDEYKTTKLVLRRIEPGSFKMGGSYNVTLTKPFYCGVFEVTQKQYSLVMGTNPSYYKGDMLPVEYVSYNVIRGSSNGAKWPSSSSVDSTSFMGKLRVRTGRNIDLPTEAQWEYACRAGTTTTYYWGNSMNGNYAWYTGNSGLKTCVVGTKKANAWGLYDMSGNVYEWCLDWSGTLFGGTDPKGPASGQWRVNRGGCWTTYEDACTSSYRHDNNPDSISYYNGFRVCLIL